MFIILKHFEYKFVDADFYSVSLEPRKEQKRLELKGRPYEEG